MSMKLIISEVKPQEIKINNKEEILKYLDENLVKYNKILTKETITEVKKDRTTLNGFINSIEDKRKEVKKVCLAPYDVIEKDFKEITSTVENVKNKLDMQLKNFEQKQKEDKKQELIEHYNMCIGDLVKLIKFEQLFNEQMLNATYGIEVAKQEIQENITRINEDLKTIEYLKSEFEIQLKDYYLQTHNLSKTLQEKARLEERKKVIDAQKRQVSEITHVERKTLLKTEIESDKQGLTYHRVFEVWGNEEQIIALGNFMKANEIKFRKIEEEK